MRNRVLSLRLTDTEHGQLAARAAAAGQRLSAFLRALATRPDRPIRPASFVTRPAGCGTTTGAAGTIVWMNGTVGSTFTSRAA